MPRIKIDDLKPKADLSDQELRHIAGGGRIIIQKIAGPVLGRKGGNVEFEWKVEEGES